jgi:hypothetical protein
MFHLNGKLIGLPANIKLTLTNLPGTNILPHPYHTKAKSSIKLTTVVHFMKFIIFVIDGQAK